MVRLFQHRAGHYLLLVAVSAALFLPNLGGPSLWDIDEPNNSACAREMLDADNWVVPTFNYVLRVDKPALLYWLQILAYQTFGVGEFAARLPSALAALLTVLLTYEFGRRLFDAATGLLGGLVLASATLFCAAAHFANPDALLNLCTVLNFFAFWQAFSRRQGAWFLLGGVAAGAGMLAKGPVAVVLPLGVSLLFLAWSRQLRVLLSRHVLGAILLGTLVVAPWYAWVGVETKAEFLRGFFLRHNLGRYAEAMEGHAGGPYYYLLVLLVGLAPWSAFLGLAAWYAAGRRGRADADLPLRGEGLPPAYRFLWCWVAVYLLFFSLGRTKLPNYVVPTYAPLALLIGRYLERWRRGDVAPMRGFVLVGLGNFALVGVLMAVGLMVVGGAVEVPWLRGQRLPGLEAWAVLGILPVAGAFGAWWWTRAEKRTHALGVLGVAAVVFLGTLAGWGVAAVDAFKAPRPLVEAVRREQDAPEIRVACYRYFQPSLVFYAHRQVWQLDSDEQVVELLRYPMEVYVFLPSAEWEGLRERVTTPWRAVARHRDLYRNCEVVVVTNR